VNENAPIGFCESQDRCVGMSSITHETLGIAVVDDDEVYRTFLSHLIVGNSNFKVFEATSGEMLNRILDTEAIDCIVLDYNLGAESGFAVKDQLARRQAVAPPIVMLTGDGRESTVIKAFRLGINDYLAKIGLNAGSLISSISHVVEKDRDLRHEKSEYQRLVRDAEVDFITGLLGCAQLELRLAQVASLSEKTRASYALILVEVVELQAVVERFGLKCGDQALRAVADRLRAACRASDICGRYGDNAFLIILDVGGSSALLEKVCETVTTELAFRIDFNSASVHLSVCAGRVRCKDIQSDGVVTPSDLMHAAEQSLAEAKSSVGKPKIAVLQTLDPGMDAANPSSGATLGTSERRSQPRQRVLKRGLIVLPAFNGTIDCTVRSTSQNGAGLRIDAPFAVPSEFDLVIAAEGFKRRVRLCWQIGINLGVEYLN
jgi:diguanylate cyclase (GGDEF)-like protein